MFCSSFLCLLICLLVLFGHIVGGHVSPITKIHTRKNKETNKQKIKINQQTSKQISERTEDQIKNYALISKEKNPQNTYKTTHLKYKTIFLFWLLSFCLFPLPFF